MHVLRQRRSCKKVISNFNYVYFTEHKETKLFPTQRLSLKFWHAFNNMAVFYSLSASSIVEMTNIITATIFDMLSMCRDECQCKHDDIC